MSLTRREQKIAGFAFAAGKHGYTMKQMIADLEEAERQETFTEGSDKWKSDHEFSLAISELGGGEN